MLATAEAKAKAAVATAEASRHRRPLGRRRRPPAPPARWIIGTALLLGVACTGSDDPIVGVAAREEPLPEVSGETLVGEPLEASTYADGRVLVINVWADWCAPCREEQPHLVRLANRYDEERVRFLGINYQDDLDAARAWVKEFDVPYPSLFDPSGRSAAVLGFPALPDTYVVDTDGIVRWVVFGATDERELAALIDDTMS